MKLYYVYLITREDGMRYVGTTDSEHIRARMLAHSKTARFRGFRFKCKILLVWKNDSVHDYEEAMIVKYDTFHNGLNLSKNGWGNHLSKKFTTKGFKFSTESRRKMSASYRKRFLEGRHSKGFKHSKKRRTIWSQKRKGKIHSRKITDQQLLELKNLLRQKPRLKGAGTKSANGRFLPYERIFSKVYGKRFDLTPNGLYKIIRGETLLWKNLERTKNG